MVFSIFAPKKAKPQPPHRGEMSTTCLAAARKLEDGFHTGRSENSPTFLTWKATPFQNLKGVTKKGKCIDGLSNEVETIGTLPRLGHLTKLVLPACALMAVYILIQRILL